ncbi:MAG: hypothetical protein J6L76_01410 [Clostridia bacterium]|nr:hypothetical protein [Clostridia bacterium]
MEMNRWKSIFDTDTFVQTLAYAMPEDSSCPGDGFMTGYGAVAGRLVFAGVQDIACLGGTVGQVASLKIARTIEMAHKHGAPFILFMESSGTRFEEGLSALSGYGEMLRALNGANGEIPTVCVIDGNCFGVCATLAGLFDFVIMTEESGYASVLSKEGPNPKNNAAACAAEGFASMVCKKAEIADTILRLLDFLPDSIHSGTDDYDGSQDDFNRPSFVCDTLQTETSYDVRNMLTDLADNGRWIELWSTYGQEMVASFARFGGKVVGILANQPSVKNGALSMNACKKAAAMIDFCDRFTIPLLTLTNSPGYADEDAHAQGDLIQASSLLAQAFASSSIPKLNIITGRAYAGALLLMNSKQVGADYVYAWDTAGICMTTPEIGALLTKRDEIQASDSPIVTRAEVIENYKNHACSPILAAQNGFVDDIIPAGQTRARIINFFQMI